MKLILLVHLLHNDDFSNVFADESAVYSYPKTIAYGRERIKYK